MSKLNFLSAIVYFLLLSITLWSCHSEEGGVREIGGLEVPEGFEIEEAVSGDLISYPFFGSYDEEGNLFLFESTETNDMGTEVMLAEPSYQIRRLYDKDGDGVFDESVIYADQLPFPMGGTYHDGSLYVAASPDLLKLTDTDGDGVADQREVLLTGWKLNQNGAILSGPFMGRDGWLYLADARRGFDITTQEGERLSGSGTRIWRCKPDGSKLEWMSGGGFDNSIELIFMPTGESIGTMTYFTDPQDGQRDALMHWVEGGVYPKYHPSIDEDGLPRTGPLMPVMTKMARVAPSGLMRYESGEWGDEYAGNLFSAEFNTGRIMRYQLTPEGATYKTNSDEPFITSTAKDIHPTDVLEDADGSLLVVVTGGWFIEGCPLSRVAKPEVKGGIYRIRKEGSKKVNRKELWGDAIHFAESDSEELGTLLSDNRYKVAERAMNELVRRGASSVSLLESKLEGSEEALQTSIIFGLYRIGGEKAFSVIREALNSEMKSVRVAAARCVGLYGDEKSIGTLGKWVVDGDLPLRRQAATALGQIGSEEGVFALLEALDQPMDRMTEHAIRFALYRIGSEKLLRKALTSGSGAKRRGALIALDQMTGYKLTEEEIIPFLSGKDPEDRELGIWIASRHEEWAGIIERYLKKVYADKNEAPGLDLRSLLLSFSSNKGVQSLIAKELVKSETTVEQDFLLEIMRSAEVSEFPMDWKKALNSILDKGEEEMTFGVLGLIESRSLKGFESKLEEIASDIQNSDELRMKALSARLMTSGSLLNEEWKYLKGFLEGEHSSTLRQSAVDLMSRSDLNSEELQELANDELPSADLLLLPKLLSVFEGNTDEKVGMSLVEGLEGVNEGLDNISLSDLEKVLSGYPERVRTRAIPLLEKIKARQSERLSKLHTLAESLGKGDVSEGRKLFYGKGICYTCHAVGGEGSDFGPDLSNIGEIRSGHDILEAIVYPSASFAREYDSYVVKTGEKTYTGVIAEQTGEMIKLKLGPGSEVRIPQSDVKSVEEHTVSMMPPGLDQQLTKEELSDLLAFLEALPYRIDRLIQMEKGK